MTLATTPPVEDYIENGVTLIHAIHFQFQAATEIICTRIPAATGIEGAPLVQGVDYSVTGGLGGTGSVTKTNGGTNGDTFRIKRFTDRSQPTNFADHDSLSSDVLDVSFDRGAAVNQDQDQRISDVESRGLRVPAIETLAPFAAAPARANMFMRWAADGKALLLQSASQLALLLAPLLVPLFPSNFKGDPGGNTMAIGLFIAAGVLNVPLGTDMVRTSGYSVNGKGVADYVNDAAVDAAYVIANPRTSFRSANARGFRLVPGYGIDLEAVGAVHDSAVTDDYPAVQGAIDALGHAGGTIFAPNGNHRISQRLVWHAPIAFLGSTISQDSRGILGNLGPTFTFDAGVGGIFVKYVNDSDAPGSPVIYSSGTGSLIQGIKLYSLSLGAASAGKFGIESRARITIRDCIVRGFGDTGVLLRGSLSGSDGVVFGNVNASLLENVDSIGNAADGFKISGNDATAVVMVRCLPQFNTGWGITDDTFLGLVTIGTIFEGNVAGTVRQLRSPSPGVHFACETEGGAISLGAAATAIGGGFGQIAGSAAFTMAGGLAQSAPYRHLNSLNATVVGAQMGSGAVEASPTAFAFGQENGSIYRDWKFALFPVLNRWGFWYGNSGSTIPMQFPDGTNSTGRSYAAEFPRGICIGNQAGVQDRLTIMAAGVPSSGTWTQGDNIPNQTPAAGGPPGWMCTTGGVAGSTAVFKAKANLAA